MNRLLRVLAVLCGLALTACATGLKTDGDASAPRLGFQDPTLHPGNGGQLVGAEALRPGDIILTADSGLHSAGIRLATLSPVSHAAVVLSERQVAEAVGSGIRLRTLPELLADEATVVAFRHPGLTAEHAGKIEAFAARHVGSKYNCAGVVLQAPFVLERRVCELPLVPPAVRDFCIRGIAAVQLGAGRNDQFFCSQFVLEAYREAGLPLTDADPRLVSPADLLHMREGDIPSIRIRQALQYVGHLKAAPPPAPATLVGAAGP